MIKINEEIEKKFKVNVNPKHFNFITFKIIEQKYLLITGKVEKRLRKTICEDKILYEQTTKIGKGKIRKEITVELSKKVFYKKWYSLDYKPIKKIRYIIPYKDKLIELDIIENYNLSFAEIEFNSEEEMENFGYPSWFGKETDIKNQDIFKKINSL